MAYKPKGKGARWLFLYAFAGIVDLAQIVIDLTGVGIAVSEIIDGAMPFILAGFLAICRIPFLTNMNRLLSIVGATGLDAITGGAAPFWVIDVWYIRRDVKKEDATMIAAEEAQEAQDSADPQPLNEDGVRLPSGRIAAPANVDGVRRPAVGGAGALDAEDTRAAA